MLSKSFLNKAIYQEEYLAAEGLGGHHHVVYGIVRHVIINGHYRNPKKREGKKKSVSCETVEGEVS
jgi:hypothetical protein